MSWEPRFMVLGQAAILIFRSLDLQQLVNVIPLSVTKLLPQKADPTTFSLHTPYWKASFRVATAEIAQQWRNAVAEAIGVGQRGSSGGGALYPDYELTRKKAAKPAPASMRDEVNEMYGAPSGPMLALPPPRLAPADTTFDNGWMQYSDDLGR